MEKPFLTITTKDFLTGLSYGAHIGAGGILYKADGVTPIFEPGASQSTKNGLLMAGAAGTALTGNIGGNILAATITPIGSGNTAAYFATAANHILKLQLNSDLSNSITDVHTAGVTLVPSMESMTDSSGGLHIFYFSTGEIGISDLTTFNDSFASIDSNYIHPSHRYFDKILFGNNERVGSIISDGAGSFTRNQGVLTMPTSIAVTDISDDGIYAIIAGTDNVAASKTYMGDTRIFFWDGYSTSWNREYPVPDPFIYAVERTPMGVFAFGVTGVYQVSFSKGVQKVIPHTPGLYSVETQYTSGLVYGRQAVSHYSEALLWGGTSANNEAIKTFGKLDGEPHPSYLHPFLATAGKNITFVSGQIAKGYVLVGDDTPSLKAYSFASTATPGTAVTAQTIYYALPVRMQVNRIDIVFGEPLASGDDFSLSVLTDEATSAFSYGSATFSADGAIRRKRLFPSGTTAQCDDQISLKLTYNGGAVKIKTIDVYGSPMTT